MNISAATRRACSSGGLLLAILLIAAALRGYKLSERSLWFDEAFSWRVAEFPWNEVIDRVARDHQPPLYFLLLKAWGTVFGDSVLAMRGLSLAFGVATVGGIYQFMSEAFCHRPGATGQAGPPNALALFTAAAVAVSVVQIRWSCEVRMYSLGTALTAYSSAVMFRALGANAAHGFWWPIYALLALALSMTHYYALFTITAQITFICGYLLWRNASSASQAHRDVRVWYAASAIAIVAAGWSWWYPKFLAQRSHVQASFWLPPVKLSDVTFALYQLFIAPENASFNAPASAAVSLICGVVLLALFVRPSPGDIFVLLSTVFPIALSVIVSLIDTKIFHPRYLVFAHLFLVAAVARLIWRIRSQRCRHSLAVLIIASGVFTHVHFWDEMQYDQRPGAKGAVAYVMSERTEEEPVIVCHSFYYFPLMYYARQASGWRCYNQGRPVVRYAGSAVVMPGDLISEAELKTIEAPRVWVIEQEGGGWGPKTVSVPAHWKSDRAPARFREAYWFQGAMVVRCYETLGPL